MKILSLQKWIACLLRSIFNALTFSSSNDVAYSIKISSNFIFRIFKYSYSFFPTAFSTACWTIVIKWSIIQELENKMSKNKPKHTINYKRFIEDFNILTLSTPENEYLYQQANFDSIEEQYDSKILKDNKGNPHLSSAEQYKLTCSLEEFKVFGPGIYLLFRFLKLITILFAILSLLLLANVIMFAVGTRLKEQNYKMDTFTASIAMTTFGNVDASLCKATSFVYFACLIVFTAGVVLWKEREEIEVLECSKQKLLPSYYTVILQTIPEGYSEAELKKFLQDNFGEIKEIFSAKEFHEDLLHYKEIKEIVEEYKIQRSLLKRNRENRNSLKLISLFKEFYYHYIRMKAHKRARYQPTFAFITFKHVSSRERLLAAYREQRQCCKTEICEQMVFKDQNLTFSPCKMEPQAINWENVTLPTTKIALRIIFQVTLILIVLAISVTVIYLLALAETNLINPKYSSYTQQQIINLNNPTITKYYCLSLSFSDFYTTQLCQSYKGTYTKIIILEIVIPLIIAILKFLFTQLMKYVVDVRRHPTEIKKIESQIIITFIFYFIISGLLQLVINFQVITSQQTSISIKRFFQTVLGSIYNIFPINQDIVLPTDFTNVWFYENSSKIILISLISFNFTSFFNLIYSILRRRICIFMAKKQELYIQTQAYLKAETLQIQFIYSFVLNIIFFTLLFGSVIPLVWIFGSVSLFVLFWVHKYIFIRYCQQPLVFSHSINHLVTRMILFGIIFSCITTPLLLGGVSEMTVSERFLSYLYFPILGAAIVIYMVFKKFLLRLIFQIKGFVSGDKDKRERLPSLICNMSFRSDALPSYSMHENEVYSHILKVLYTLNSNERSRVTFMLNEHLSQFFEQYQSNDNYENTFKDLLDNVRADSHKFNKLHKSRAFSNPYEESQKTIKEMLKVYSSAKSRFSNKRVDSNNPMGSINANNDQNYQNRLQRYEKNDEIRENQSCEPQDKNSDENLQSDRGLSQQKQIENHNTPQ